MMEPLLTLAQDYGVLLNKMWDEVSGKRQQRTAVTPKQCASLLAEVATRFSFYDKPNEPDEVICLLAWYLAELVEDDRAKWTGVLGGALTRLRPGITSKRWHERFAAYSEAKENRGGGEPLWHIARTFQFYILGVAPLHATHRMELSIHLAGLMKAVSRLSCS
jgi:hypothetical protein